MTATHDDIDFGLVDTTDPDRDSWTPVILSHLPDKPPVQPTLGGLALVYPGKRHVFSGPPESAKTLIAYALMLEVIRAGDTVVLIDFEMGGYDARGRLLELGATREELDQLHYIEPDERATDERIQHLVELTPTLVVLDAAAGAYDLEGLDDSKRGDVEKFSRLYIRPFWRTGIATVVIDHVVKDSEQRGHYAIGSERKLGGSDVHLGFDTIVPISRGTAGVYKITNHKDRGAWLKRGKIADVELVSDPDTHRITWTIKPAEHVPPSVDEPTYFRPTKLMEKVSVCLEKQNEPVTRNAIFAEMGGTKKWVLAAITALVIEGFVEELAGSHRARPVQLTRVFRESEHPERPENAGANHSEPPNTLSEQTTTGDLAQPSGGSVVRSGISVVREPADSGGSGGSSPYGDDTSDLPSQEPLEGGRWFDDLAYLDTIDQGNPDNGSVI